MFRKLRAIIFKSLVIVILVLAIVLIAVLKKNPEVAEAMTRGFSRGYVQVASSISGAVPFLSFMELMAVIFFIVIVLLLVLIIRDLIKIRPLKAVSKLLTIPVMILTVVALYSLSCEMAYNRKEMPLPYYENEVDRTEFVDIYNYFADDLNYCVTQLEFDENGDVKGYDLNETTKLVKEAYAIVTDDYFASYFGAVKPMMSSFVYLEFQITGVSFNAFGEANINTMNTKANYPITIAHELAHTKGVMREDDANKLAFYVCLNSESPYLRYSAYTSYFYQMRSMVSSSYLTESERENLHPLDPAYNKTQSYIYNFWKKHNLLEDIGNWFNNLYIKSSGVPEGTSSYSGGTEHEFDPTTNKLKPSLYQKLYFEKYYR